MRPCVSDFDGLGEYQIFLVRPQQVWFDEGEGPGQPWDISTRLVVMDGRPKLLAVTLAKCNFQSSTRLGRVSGIAVQGAQG